MLRTPALPTLTSTWRSIARSAHGALGWASILPVCLLGTLGLAPMLSPSTRPDQEDREGSGIIVRTDVIAVWVSPDVLDLAQRRAGHRADRARAVTRAPLPGRGPSGIAYALTYRGYQANGGFADITQLRLNEEIDAHLEEFQRVLSTVGGNPPRSAGLDFSHAEVRTLPEALLNVDPRGAMPVWTELMGRGPGR